MATEGSRLSSIGSSMRQALPRVTTKHADLLKKVSYAFALAAFVLITGSQLHIPGLSSKVALVSQSTAIGMLAMTTIATTALLASSQLSKKKDDDEELTTRFANHKNPEEAKANYLKARKRHQQMVLIAEVVGVFASLAFIAFTVAGLKNFQVTHPLANHIIAGIALGAVGASAVALIGKTITQGLVDEAYEKEDIDPTASRVKKIFSKVKKHATINKVHLAVALTTFAMFGFLLSATAFNLPVHNIEHYFQTVAMGSLAAESLLILVPLMLPALTDARRKAFSLKDRVFRSKKV